MTEIRKDYLIYLISLGFSRADCKTTWNAVDDYFTESIELTKEVMTRDILRKLTTIESLKEKYNKWGNVK